MTMEFQAKTFVKGEDAVVAQEVSVKKLFIKVSTGIGDTNWNLKMWISGPRLQKLFHAFTYRKLLYATGLRRQNDRRAQLQRETSRDHERIKLITKR